MVSEPVQVLMDPARCLSVQNWTVVLCVLQIDAIHRKEAMKAMTETFYAAIFGYDEVRRKQELFFLENMKSIPDLWVLTPGERPDIGPGLRWRRVKCVSVFLQGILSDDCVLAAALWRNLFNCQCDDPQQLELMVEYVRKQVCWLLSRTSCQKLYHNIFLDNNIRDNVPHFTEFGQTNV